jgi:hypothetical protein
MTYFELVFGGYREPPTKRLPILGVGELIFVNFCCAPEPGLVSNGLHRIRR